MEADRPLIPSLACKAVRSLATAAGGFEGASTGRCPEAPRALCGSSPSNGDSGAPVAERGPFTAGTKVVLSLVGGVGALLADVPTTSRGIFTAGTKVTFSLEGGMGALLADVPPVASRNVFTASVKAVEGGVGALLASWGLKAVEGGVGALLAVSLGVTSLGVTIR